MAVINALFSTAFLILVAASAAVTGSMVVLALIDRAFRKKKAPEPSLESPREQESGDPDQDNRGEIEDALETLHAEQMKKFGASEDALEGRRFRWRQRQARARARQLRKRERTSDPVVDVGLLAANGSEEARKHR
jgi:hypothetical protein